MKSFATAFANHLLKSETTLCTCWQVLLNDGVTYIRATDHDQPIPVTDSRVAGTYYAITNITGSDMKSKPDMSVDNMSVTGAVPETDGGPADITIDRINSGVLDGAFVVVFICNWASPSDGISIVRSGTIGNIGHDTDSSYNTEIRGLNQFLQQQIGYTFSTQCNAQFGDSRCQFDVTAASMDVQVTAVTDQKNFTVVVPVAPPISTFYNRAKIEFLTGLNENFFSEIKQATVSGTTVHIQLYDEMPETIAINDFINLPPGCNKQYNTCRDTFANTSHNRAYGLKIPGLDAISKGPIT